MNADPKSRPRLLDSPLFPRVLKLMSKAQTATYRATGGRLAAKYRMGSAFPRGLRVCLLTTIGRKSGKPRTTPLVYLADGDHVVLYASQGGLPRHPHWYLNLSADPDVTVQVGRTVRPMRARAADDAERAALWPRLLVLNPDFADYQAWNERTIPIVVCEPAESADHNGRRP